MRFIKLSSAAAAAALACAAQAAPVLVSNTDGMFLASAIAGSGISVSNAVLTTNTVGGNGVFFNGAPTVGFNSGIVLTTGSLACIAGPNSSGECSAAGSSSELSFNFTTDTGYLSLDYVFGSDEYNTGVNGTFNDTFEVLLNGVNIALLPGGGGPISINNVNCLTNAAHYRNNSSELTAGGVPCPVSAPNLGLDIGYDGLTVALTASGFVGAGTHHLTLRIQDVGDGSIDSGVFIRANSLSSVNAVPEPGSLPLAAAALAFLAAVLRRRPDGARASSSFCA